MRVFDATAVHAALPWGALADALHAAFVRGAEVPLRHVHTLSASDVMLLMPAWDERLIVTKLVTAIPGAPSTVCATVLAVDRATGHLTFLNQVDFNGRNPVHLALDAQERHLVVSSHLTGEVVVVEVRADGTLGAVTHREALPGEPGPHRKEQPFAKPHFNPLDPSGEWVIVPDKGLDRVCSFRMEGGRLTPAAQPWLEVREGAGPRNLAFHPSQPWAYVVNELDSTVAAGSTPPTAATTASPSTTSPQTPAA